MAVTLSLLFLTPLLSSLHPGSAQDIVVSSAYTSKPPLVLLPPVNYSAPYPQTGGGGRVDNGGPAQDRGLNEVPQEEPREDFADARPTPSLLWTLSPPAAQNGGNPGGGGLVMTRPPTTPTGPSSKPRRTDTAGLAFSRSTRRPPRTTTTTITLTTTATTTPSTGVPTGPAGGEPGAASGGSGERGPLSQNEEEGVAEGSDPVPTAMRAAQRDGSPDPPPPDEETTTLGTEASRVQTAAPSSPEEPPVPSLKMAEAQTPTALSVTVRPGPSGLTLRDDRTTATTSSTPPPSDTGATFNPTLTTPQASTAQPGVLTGELTANTPPTERTTTPRQESTSGPVEPSTTTTTSTSTTTTPDTTTTTPATYVNITLQPTAGTTERRTNATQPGTRTTTTTTTTTATVLTPSRTTNTTTNETEVVPVGRGRHGVPGIVVIDATAPKSQNRSSVPPLGRPAPPAPVPPPTPSPSSPSPSSPSPNGTLLRWDDLWRTLAFAWPLHVYGSAALFLLLLAGAALGLATAPAMATTCCPHRGALGLANALLFLAGGLRAALFLIDPYGARGLLPRGALTALYNLPLHLLVWTQAALALLALRAVEVRALPPTLERPPLAAVLAVLQGTLLLAADLLSPALSPAVPVTLQVLSLCWGLAVCLGFLCYVFPRLRGCPPGLSAGGDASQPGSPASPPPPAGDTEEGGKPWPRGGRRTGLVLGRVLAVCALLGALCCGLHVHATLWIYGLLGDWRRFNWGWWLVHFWARLLELAWGFSLLLLGSWVFWRPAGGPLGGQEGAPGDGRAGGELPSPGQSAASSHRHTCWSKIVQSLTGKPCKKSDSNGVSLGVGGLGAGGGGAVGEAPPNNWAGLNAPAGADISKSLIRNQSNHHHDESQRCVKDSNHGRNQQRAQQPRGGGVFSDGSAGSLLRLQALGGSRLAGSDQQDKDLTDPSSLSLYEFDLRPPSPIDLGRSIDDALHREHLLGAGSLFQPLSLGPSSPYAPPELGYAYGNNSSGTGSGPWLRRNSDPMLLLSDSSDAPTESSAPLGGSVMSSVPSRQVTAPPTPSHHQGEYSQMYRWEVPSSVSCPVSLRQSGGNNSSSAGHLEDNGTSDDTRPFLTPDSDARPRGRAGRARQGSRSYLEVSRLDDTNSVSSEIIDL